MALIDTDDWISQFWDEVEKDYPSIDFSHFQEICKSVFKFIKWCMSKETLPKILVKYLGRLEVFPVTIRKILDKDETRLKYGYITIDEWECRKATLEYKLYMVLNPQSKKKKQPTRQIIFIQDDRPNQSTTI